MTALGKTWLEQDYEAPEWKRQCIAGQLRSAALILEQNLDGARDDSVAWRVADAALDLREVIEASGAKDIGGVHGPTGYGAELPRRHAHHEEP